jgi:photosystem II stability/assembly factor-like uncharacterized protein
MITHAKEGAGPWETQHGGTHETLESFFVTPSGTHFIVGMNGLLLGSEDGQSWKKWPLPVGDKMICDIWGDEQGLFLVGADGLVLCSTDDGKSWTKQKSGVKEYISGIWGCTARDGSSEIYAAGSRGTLLISKDRGKSWKGQPSDLRIFHGVWGNSPDSVFMFGTGFKRSIDRGATWTDVDTKSGGAEVFVCDMHGRGNDIYAVGRDAFALASHDGGKSWTRLMPPTTNHLQGVWVTPEGKVYVAGCYATLLSSSDQGKSWQPEELKDVSKTERGISHLWGIGGAPNGNLYAIGDDMELLCKKPGKGWVEQRNKNMNWLEAVWGEESAARVYASGHGGTLLVTEDGGTNWNRIPSGSKGHIRSIWGTRDGKHVFAVGESAILRSHDRGRTWNRTGVPYDLVGIWGEENKDGKLVRLIAISDYDDVVLSSPDGDFWMPPLKLNPLRETTKGKKKVSASLRGIWGSPGGAIYIVGQYGLILCSRDGGKKWEKLESGTTEHLNAIWGRSAKDIFAVGYHGTVLNSTDEGKTWKSEKLKTIELSSIYGMPTGELYAVGNKGVIFRATPDDTWRKQRTDSDDHLHGVWCSPSGELYAVGDN